jgi:uncharacterized membrane protein YbhN (UPF0104 family)
MRLPRFRLPRSRLGRMLVSLVLFAAFAALFWWRGPAFRSIGDAFTAVHWEWVVVAIALNLLSVVVRAMAWSTVIRSALEPPHPRFMLVFSAFSVGLFANAILPGRIGELARVAVLTRKLPGRPGAWATLVGTVVAHRLFDVPAVLLLVLYVIATANIPRSAQATLIAVVVLGVALFAFAFATARRPQLLPVEGLGPVRRLLRMARAGLGVLRSPSGAAAAILLQICGWVCQLFAVFTAMRAFDIHAPLPAAGVVLLVMNVVTILPFWPGNNVGLLQVAIASVLKGYGVPYATGVAYGFGLQAIEASVGIGVGMLFLAREGLSVAMLRVMPGARQAEMPEAKERKAEDARAERARVPG